MSEIFPGKMRFSSLSNWEATGQVVNLSDRSIQHLSFLPFPHCISLRK